MEELTETFPCCLCPIEELFRKLYIWADIETKETFEIFPEIKFRLTCSCCKETFKFQIVRNPAGTKKNSYFFIMEPNGLKHLAVKRYGQDIDLSRILIFTRTLEWF